MRLRFKMQCCATATPRMICIYECRLRRRSPAGHGALEEIYHLLSMLLQAIIEINPL